MSNNDKELIQLLKETNENQNDLLESQLKISQECNKDVRDLKEALIKDKSKDRLISILVIIILFTTAIAFGSKLAIAYHDFSISTEPATISSVAYDLL